MIATAGKTTAYVIGGASSTIMKGVGAVAGFQAIFGENVDRSDAGLAKAFAAIDTDRSGRVSVDEVRAHILSQYGKSLDADTLGAMLLAGDTDGDGELDLREFTAIMQAGPSRRGGALDTMPKAKVTTGVATTVNRAAKNQLSSLNKLSQSSLNKLSQRGASRVIAVTRLQSAWRRVLALNLVAQRQHVRPRVSEQVRNVPWYVSILHSMAGMLMCVSHRGFKENSKTMGGRVERKLNFSPHAHELPSA